MEFKDCALMRRSYRHQFSDKEISRNILKEILEIAYQVPSACNLQSAHFVAVDDAAILNQLADLYGKTWAKSAKAAILIATNPEKFKIANQNSRYLEDFGAAAEQVLLAISNFNLASCWIQGQIEGEIADKMGKLVNLPQGFLVLGYFPIGYPTEAVKDPKKYSFNERCFINEWGKTF